ncbi:redox-sensing transcriptional repressor Rex [Scatolibacter rhodanostii]|uniref:redox-sensing transcriptional repressor Rex n=1 Tax=Scatolibacter rhodanostii TaxID=2014781 RepID=UPI000C08BE33|nr:redox-sensing transcriptional repressor Rex [Scatolibacter rhodanostii]
MDNVRPISKQTLKRLPVYLNYLKSLTQEKTATTSATQIAQALGFHDVQVRKDLAAVSSGGKPRVGYVIRDLVYELEDYLGYNNTDCAVLVGTGKLGKVLMEYQGFSQYNIEIVAGFDVDCRVVGTSVGGKKILSAEKLKSLCNRLNIKLGIIAVPEEEAQQVCEQMIESGIIAIWNFAQLNLCVPDGVLVQNENIGSSLAVLTKYLSEKVSW